jgi:hypothetical protein
MLGLEQMENNQVMNLMENIIIVYNQSQKMKQIIKFNKRRKCKIKPFQNLDYEEKNLKNKENLLLLLKYKRNLLYKNKMIHNKNQRKKIENYQYL